MGRPRSVNAVATSPALASIEPPSTSLTTHASIVPQQYADVTVNPSSFVPCQAQISNPFSEAHLQSSVPVTSWLVPAPQLDCQMNFESHPRAVRPIAHADRPTAQSALLIDSQVLPSPALVPGMPQRGSVARGTPDVKVMLELLGLTAAHPEPVSYTHLTLPTKRIV